MKKALTVVEKKDRFNLRPALEFVARHADIYEGFVHDFMDRPFLPVGAVAEFTTLEEHLIGDSVHLTGDEAREICSRLPEVFQELSMLVNINYHFARIVPVPLFEEDGEWKGAVDMVEEAQFPRPCLNDRAHRILIGRCDGTMIFPSALPESIHESVRARWIYQLHVMLHEFFHTIEYLRRDPAITGRIMLRCGVNIYTFRDWWQKWEELFVSLNRPLFPTRYAESYGDFLTPEIRANDPVAFTRAIAEQVAESFVGYIMGVVPNDQNNHSFKDHSPEAWALIHELATSSVLEIG